MTTTPHLLARAALLLTLLAPPALFGQATLNPDARPADPLSTTAKPLPTPAPASRGWWNDAVFYEVFIRSFADSTTGPLANDGIGDIQGLIGRLDDLKALGINALWLMPVTDSPSYHGYDTTDYKKVEPDYGTNEDFKRLAAACKALGIRVVIDLVLNHCSDRHPWFTAARRNEPPHRDWFIWADTRPDWKGPWNQTVWHPTLRGQPASNFYYGIFNRDMPDLNYTNPGVTREMHDTARYWLTEMGVDGFRLDAVRHLIEDGKVQENTPATHAWLAEFHKACKQARPDCFNVGEIWAGTEQIAPYVGPAMDSAFEFELASAIMQSVKDGKAAPINAALAKTLTHYAPGAFSTFLTNHDQPRVMTEFKNDTTKAKAAAAILLTLPGIPFIYYGEEIGMTGPKPDPAIRTPMQWSAGPAAGFTTGKPWQPLNQDAATVNVQTQRDDPHSLYNHYQRLITLRKANPALRTGQTHLLNPASPSLLAFTRTSQAQSLLIVINLATTPINWSDEPTLAAHRGPEVFTSSPADQTLPPGSVSIYTLKP